MSDLGSILVVDDEPELCETLRDFFTEQGYRVDTAMNAGDALMLVSLNRPDAIILDIRLPDSNGADLLSELLRIDRSLAIVMLSGLDDEALARATLKAGAFDYVRKPFDLLALERTMTLAVAVGRQRPRRGVVVPLHRERVKPDAPEASEPAPSCPRCRAPVVDKNAVVQRGTTFHAVCWLRAQSPSRPG
jgi:DNA-binding response OmpR family regulator